MKKIITFFTLAILISGIANAQLGPNTGKEFFVAFLENNSPELEIVITGEPNTTLKVSRPGVPNHNASWIGDFALNSQGFLRISVDQMVLTSPSLGYDAVLIESEKGFQSI
jgi:hypothetical protein